MKKTFSVYGDSISTFEGTMPLGWRTYYEGDIRRETGVLTQNDTWWGLVGTYFGWEFLSNASWSGCVVEGSEFPVGASKKRIAALVKNGCTPDIILVHIGINDYGWGSADAQIAAATASAPPKLAAACPYHGRIAGMAPKDAIEKFSESYARMLSSMHALCPHAHIWTSTLVPGRLIGCTHSTSPRYFRGIPARAYNDAIRAATAATKSCSLADMAALGFDYEAVDGTHPTARGMRQIATMFIGSMQATQPHLTHTSSAFANTFTAELSDDMRSQEFCTRPCVGCEYARSTGNSWLHVCERQLNTLPPTNTLAHA